MLDRRKHRRRRASWLTDAKGADSILRLCVLIAVIQGCVIADFALYGFLRGLSSATIVLGAGTALITTVLTLKVWQRSVEEKGVADAGEAVAKVEVAQAETKTEEAKGNTAEGNAALLQRMDEPAR